MCSLRYGENRSNNLYPKMTHLVIFSKAFWPAWGSCLDLTLFHHKQIWIIKLETTMMIAEVGKKKKQDGWRLNEEDKGRILFLVSHRSQAYWKVCNESILCFTTASSKQNWVSVAVKWYDATDFLFCSFFSSTGIMVWECRFNLRTQGTIPEKMR